MRYLIFVFVFAACGSAEKPLPDSSIAPSDMTADVSQPDLGSQDSSEPDMPPVEDNVEPSDAVVDISVPDVAAPDSPSSPDQAVSVDMTPPADEGASDVVPKEDLVEPIDIIADAAAPDVAQGDTSDVVEQPPLEFSLVSNDLYINCMPIVGPDPILGSFTSDVLNPGTGMFPGDIMIVEARLDVNSGTIQETYYFSVEPQMVSVESQTGIQTLHQKYADSLLSDGNTLPCQLCDGEWTLVVTAWEGATGLETQKSLGPFPVQCVY